MDFGSLPHVSAGAQVEQALDAAGSGIVAVDLSGAGVAAVSRTFLESLPQHVPVIDALANRAHAETGPVTVVESVAGKVTPEFVTDYGAVVIGREAFAPPVPLRNVCPITRTLCDCTGDCLYS